jgi:hypothetical protein
MDEMMVNWIPLSDTQVRTATDARQYFDLLTLAETKLAGYPGWLFWKTYPNGREYLVHAYDRTGRGTTLGARSAENEAHYEQFKAGQDDAKLRVKFAREKLTEQARFCKAARLNRFPRAATQVARAFDNAGWGKNFLIAGTHALYAYEALADVQFLAQILETADLDLLWDAEARLEVVMKGEVQDINPEEGALGLLKKVDKTYTRNEERTFQAISASGFVVDFLRPLEPLEPPLIGKDDRLNPIALKGLDWLVEGAMDVVVIDYEGLPMTLRVPDPRIFAAHKLWLSERKDRKPGKRDRDTTQAKSIAELLKARQPVLPDLTPPDDLKPYLVKLGL